jgi:hypothetical protein
MDHSDPEIKERKPKLNGERENLWLIIELKIYKLNYIYNLN